ncbi:helicase POLQ-like isoform X2 [Zootermopsis nevadensis]|uniref:Helicase POLQ-like n=1 Tax=Zootermopsis nevadensis TaxID=136037 RepID=A0A067RDE2_ZOONE|nr:helicase POLQ-like isoform X2 [Zootermopsis nevadensis]KDR16820.1 Helicase POLQ-like [Zootermopsis nevadensis]
MGEEIVRKVINRNSYRISKYKENGHLGNQNPLNPRSPLLFEKTEMDPCMTSTPQKFRRKTIDNSECHTVAQWKGRRKTCSDSNDPTENITPLKSQKTKHFGLVKGITSLNRRTDACRNVCGESFDITAVKSLTQCRMLSLDESVLEAIDLDSAVKDYWNSQNRNLNLDVQSIGHDNQCESPDLFEGSGNVVDDEMINFMRQLGDAASCKVVTQCSKSQCDVVNLSSKVTHKLIENDSECKDPHVGINSDQNANFKSIDVAWENDSFFEDAVCLIDKDLPASNSPSLSNLPLGEKIKRTLITNVQKPVTPKPKSLHINPGHILQNHSSSLVKVSTPSDSGAFFGLPLKVKLLIQKFKGISDLYPWQKECLNLDALQWRKNLVYSLPTSGGKTLVAEILILRELLCHRKNAILALPYVAIVQEKVRSLAPFGLELEFFVEEYAAGKGQYPPPKRRKKQTVYVATIEKALGLTNSLIEEKRLEELGLFIVDELHLLGESNGRGSTLEGLLTKLLYVQASIQIVGMSATIGNLHEVAKFLDAETYAQDFRPVELKEYVKCEDGLYAVNWKAACPDEFLILERKLSFSYSATAAAVDPDLIGGLVMEVIPENSCLVFCPTKKNCENVAQLICRVLPKEILQEKKEEKKALYRALMSEGNGSVCPVLKKILPFGMAYHHSGLTADEKHLLQEAFRTGTLCCICCTSTLAAGVNLPAKRVILRSPFVGRDFINLSRYKQMVGRAGRAGFGETGESILICKTNEALKVKQLLCSEMDDVTSTLHLNDGLGIQNLILSAVGLGIATTRLTLQKLISCSLLSLQASRLNVNLVLEIDNILTQLIKLKALHTIDPEESSPNSSTMLTADSNVSVHMLSASKSGTEKNKPLTPTHNKREKHNVIAHLKSGALLRVSRLGKAAIKGCMHLSRAHTLYQDLVQAQSSLVLSSYLHLLYLVTPYDLMSQVKPNPVLYFSAYNRLDVKDFQTTNVLGISEVCMARMVNGQTVKSGQGQVLNRFYLTLMLYDLWNQRSVWDVADEYEVPRGFVQTLMTSSAAFSSCVLRFCEEMKEFWAFRDLLVNFTQQLSHCCTAELLQLMDLPAVKRGRARQLYKAGYKTLRDVANADPKQMVHSIDHLPKKTANQIVAAAKLLLKQKAESLREEAEDVLEGLQYQNQSQVK